MARMNLLSLFLLLTWTLSLSQVQGPGLLLVDGSAGAPTLKSCIDALPASGGTCTVPPNHSEKLSSDLILRSNVVLQFLGPCTITLGPFSVQVPQGSNNISIFSPFAHSSDRAGHSRGCSFIGYTGSGAAVEIGSNAAFTYNVLIRGINVSLYSAPSGAVAFRHTNCVDCPMEYDEAVGGPVSGQIGYQFNGVGEAFSGTTNLLGLECNYSASSTNGVCLQFVGAANSYPMLGGHANMGGKTNHSVCIDVVGPDASAVDPGGFDCDVAGTAVTVESKSTTAIRGFIRIDTGVGSFVNFGPGTKGNQIWTNARTSLLAIVDNGLPGTNSIIDGFDSQVNSRNFRIIGNSKSFSIIDQSSKTPIMVGIPGKDTRLNAGEKNPLDFNWDSGYGERFCDGARGCNLVIDADGVIHPAKPGGVNLGLNVAPFAGIYIGSGSEKDTQISSSATKLRNIHLPDASGTVALVVAFGRFVLQPHSIPAGECGPPVGASAPGAGLNDTVAWSYARPIHPPDAKLVISTYIEDSEVKFIVCNPTAEAISAARLSLNWEVLGH